MASGWTAAQLSRCMIFQDSAGTLPVFAPEQPIGLVLDCRYAPGSRGVELAADVEINNPGAWSATETAPNTASATGGVAAISSVDGGYTAISGPLSSPTKVGSLYEVTYEVVSVIGPGLRLDLFSAPGLVRSAVGVYKEIRLATSAIFNFRIVRGGGSVSGGSITSVSVREIPGLPLTQSSTMARPAASARVNLLVATENFTNAAWQKVAGGVTAGVFIPDTSSTIHRIAQPISPVLNIPYSVQGRIKSEGVRYVYVNTIATLGVGFVIDLQTGSTIVAGLSQATAALSVALAADGFWDFTYRGIGTGIVGNFLFFQANNSFIAIDRTYSGDNIAGFIATKPQLELGSVATPYQRVTTASDYDTLGFPFKAQFNGTNQWLTHAALDMTSTDEVTLWASLLKESDVGAPVAYEILSSFTVHTPGANNAPHYRIAYRAGGPLVEVTASGFPAPNKSTLIARSKVSTDVANLTVNGSTVVSSSADQGIGNYKNNTGFIGSRSGTSVFFRGEIYELGIAGKVITDGQLQSLNARMTRSAKI
jgi:hypothetical protein